MDVIKAGKEYLSSLGTVCEVDIPEAYLPGDTSSVCDVMSAKRSEFGVQSLPSVDQKCKVKFEVQHLQDLSSSFRTMIDSRQQLVEEFTDQLTGLYPGSGYGWSTFSDKPLPYMGYGDYADMNGSILHDHCYKNTYPLSSGDLGELINLDNLHVLGGYDHMENNMGASVAGVLDNEVGWTEDVVVDGTINVRVQFIFVDAIPHVGESDIPNLRMSAQSNIDFWNEDFLSSSVRDQYVFSFGECAVGGAVWTEGSLLRAKYDATTLTAPEETRFDEIVDLCGPFPIDDMLPFDLAQYSEVYREPGVPENVKDQLCKTMEYPSWSEWAEFYNSDPKMVLPVFITHAPNDHLLPLYHYYDVCDDSVTDGSICLAEFYRNKLIEHNVTGLAFALPDISSDVVGKSSRMMGFVMDVLNSVYSEMDCGCDNTSPPCPCGNCPCDQLEVGQVEIRSKLAHGVVKEVRDIDEYGYAVLTNNTTTTALPNTPGHNGQSITLFNNTPKVDELVANFLVKSPYQTESHKPSSLELDNLLKIISGEAKK